MRFTLVFLFLFLSTVVTLAQQRPYSITNKEAIRYFAEANEALDEHLYDEAANDLKKAIEVAPKFVEAYAQLGDIYRLRHQHQLAAEQYLKLIAINPDFNHAVYLKLGDEEVAGSKYVEAQQHLEKYLTYQNFTAQNVFYAKKLIADCVFSIQALAHPVPFKPINMGSGINTANDEYLPVATADEGTLIFTRKIDNNEDFYKSLKIDGKWATAISLSDQINTPQYNEGAQSISQDGKYLFFTGCNRPDGLGRCDIYISRKRVTTGANLSILVRRLTLPAGNHNHQLVLMGELCIL